jgi:hypothetical protein
MRKTFFSWILPSALLIAQGVALSQSSHSVHPISINGHTGQATVYQINGKSFISIEDLAQIVHGTVSYSGEQISISLPAAEEAANPSQEANATLSAQFMEDSVKALSVLEEWTTALAHAAQRGTPGDGSRIVIFHNRAASAMRLAKAAAVSDSDQSALQLLTHHFNVVSAWSDKLIAERKRMDTAKYSTSEGAIERDETYQKITACAKFLNTMLPSGAFQDDNSCH